MKTPRPLLARGLRSVVAPGLALLALVGCERPAEPLLDPVEAEVAGGLEGELVAVALDGDGGVWMLADHGDDSGALLHLGVDRASVDEVLEVGIGPADVVWFVGGWVVVGSVGDEASFRRVEPDGTSSDGGEPFDGRFLAVAADAEHAVVVGERSGQAVGVDIDTTGAFQETWTDLEGLLATDVAVLAGETYLATEQSVGGSQILRRGPDGDTRTRVSLLVQTLTPLTDSVYAGGATVPPTGPLPAFAWLGPDLGVSEVGLPARGGEGEISASVPWPDGGVVRAERGGVERSPDEVVIALVRPSDADRSPSRWAQPLGGGTTVRVHDLLVLDERVLVIGSVDGRAAWWLVRPV